jgi:hypothetical protein
MIKFIMPLIMVFLSCEKQTTVCGVVVASPSPSYNSDSSEVRYYVPLKQDKNGLLRWVEITEEQKSTLSVGDNLCATI